MLKAKIFFKATLIYALIKTLAEGEVFKDHSLLIVTTCSCAIRAKYQLKTLYRLVGLTMQVLSILMDCTLEQLLIGHYLF